MKTFKFFWTLWSPSSTMRSWMRTERAYLEHRRQAIMAQQVRLRIKLAATTSAIEQIDLELQ